MAFEATITRRAALLGTGALAVSGVARAQGLTPFTVGVASPSTTFLAIWTARDAGFYAQRGLDFNLFDMVGGAEAGPTLSSGKIQLMHIGLSSVIRANARGADLRAIGSLSNVIRFTLFAKDGVTSAAQLKGGTIGISSAGSESEATLAVALERLGLQRSDVTLKEIGTGNDRFKAVRSGAVTAASLNDPYRTQALEAGMKPLLDLVPERVSWVYSGLVTTRAYAQSNRDTLMKFLRATIEGNYLALTDEAKGKASLAKALNITNSKVLDAGYREFKDQSPRNAEASRDGAERNVRLVAPAGASKNVDDYVDFSFNEALRKEGFLDEMEKKYGKG